MGKAYTDDQRLEVKRLLEGGRDEDSIEKQTGVSDRTIRRWKLELERTGRIGKPPESRTGRHRVLSPEMEAAIFAHADAHPEMSVDDILWWLYETHEIVVGTRTIRRAFERKRDKTKPAKPRNRRKSSNVAPTDTTEDVAPQASDDAIDQSLEEVPQLAYQSPYESMVPPPVSAADQQILQQTAAQSLPYPATVDFDAALPDDPETIELQLQQIALQKREVELKLKMRQLKSGKGANAQASPGNRAGNSSLFNPHAVIPNTPKRDSRSKKKIEESKKRTAERQARMLSDLERRSRRRQHLTAEWVQSKDIWPLRAQGLLANLMHRYGYYAFNQNQIDAFEAMFHELYQLVDTSKGDWVSPHHDNLLRDRMKRKMGQLRAKMQKTGEVTVRNDGFGGFQKTENYTGEQAGDAIGDESEMVSELQVQGGGTVLGEDDGMHYEPVPDHHQSMQNAGLPYAHAAAMMNAHQSPPQYPLMDQHHPAMISYTQMEGQMDGQGGLL